MIGKDTHGEYNGDTAMGTSVQVHTVLLYIYG